MYACVCIYIHKHMCVRMCVYVCMYTQRERERDFKELAHMIAEAWQV